MKISFAQFIDDVISDIRNDPAYGPGLLVQYDNFVFFSHVCCKYSFCLVLPPQTLTVGQVLLGCISEVRNYELVVSLPHKLVGSVSLAHISRPYTALLSKVGTVTTHVRVSRHHSVGF